MNEAVPPGWAPVLVRSHDDRLVAECRAVDLDALHTAFFDEDVNLAMGQPFAAAFPALADLEALAQRTPTCQPTRR